MDAKITKPRLGNFLSYEWIRILVALVAVIGVLCIFFTTISTQPRNDQQYELYCYTGLSMGPDSRRFDDILTDEDVFSYDILVAQMESLDTAGVYGGSAYAARRAAGQGEAMFVSSERYTETDGDGNEQERDRLTDFIEESLSDKGEATENIDAFLDFPAYMHGCEQYLAGVFGADWKQNDVPDDDAVRKIFTARNGGDKRFRSAEKQEEGVALERARLIGLRRDYLEVSALIERGVYSYTEYTSQETGKTYTVALGLDGLTRLNNLVYYSTTDENGATVRASEGIHLVLFRNGRPSSDLVYESISLLRWLYEEYGA